MQLGQIPSPGKGEIETVLIAATAIAAIFLVWKKLLSGDVKQQEPKGTDNTTIIKKADYVPMKDFSSLQAQTNERFNAVNGRVDELCERVEGSESKVLLAMERSETRLLEAGERRSVRIHERLDVLGERLASVETKLGNK